MLQQATSNILLQIYEEQTTGFIQTKAVAMGNGQWAMSNEQWETFAAIIRKFPVQTPELYKNKEQQTELAAGLLWRQHHDEGSSTELTGETLWKVDISPLEDILELSVFVPFCFHFHILFIVS